MLRINLGCSDQILPEYLNVDLVPPADKIVDLCNFWPWRESSVDHIRAWDIIEHLPDPVHTMNEAWRVLKPGGTFEIVVPTTDGRGAFQDPGHVSFWNRNSFFYYTDRDPHRVRFGGANKNGVLARFRVVSEKQERLRDEVEKLTIVLEAVKS